MRLIPFVVLALTSATSSAEVGVSNNTDLPTASSLYTSQNDPAGVNPHQILVIGYTFKYGSNGEMPFAILKSDIGFQGYLTAVNGGIAIMPKPIALPNIKASKISFTGYECASEFRGDYSFTSCRSTKTGKLYHSTAYKTYILSFDLDCLDYLDKVCEYKLARGSGMSLDR